MSNGIYVYVHHCFFVNNQFSAKKKIKYKKKCQFCKQRRVKPNILSSVLLDTDTYVCIGIVSY